MTAVLVRQGGVWVRPGYAPVDPGGEYDYVVNPGDNAQTVLNTAPTGAAILFKPGDHAVDALAPKNGQRLVGQTGTRFIGSSNFSGNSWTSDGSGHWYTAVTLPDYTESTAVQCEMSASNPCRKREQVWLDGAHLTRVMTLGELTAGGFYQDYAADRVYLGVDPTGHDVRMASKAHAVSTTATGVRITGIEVLHYATPSQLGALYLRGDGAEVDHCVIHATHAIGIFLDGADSALIHDNEIHHCGQLGIGSHASHGAQFARNWLHHNNTDGYRPDDWESGDIKITYSDSVIVEDNTCEDSRGLGIWLDIENGLNGRCYIRRNTVRRTYADGIRHEISYACDIYDNTVEYTGFQYAADNGEDTAFTGYSGFGTAGININTSRDVNVYGNRLGPNQNGIFAQFRPRATSDFPNRDLINLNVHDNDVTLVPVTLTGKNGNSYTSGLKSGEGVSGLNTLMGSSGIPTAQYYDGTKNNRFDNNTYRVSSPSRLQYAWNQGYRSYDTFRSAGQETGPNAKQVSAPRDGWQITASNRDGAWHNTSAGLFSSSGTKLFVGDNAADVNDADRNVWLLFEIALPAAADLTQAFLYLYATGLTGTVPRMLIDAEKSIAAAVPTSRANVNAKARTTASVAWSPSTWTANSWQQSPDLSTILEELAAQPGWSTASPVMLFVRTHPDDVGNQTGQLSFNAYETDPALSGNLQATWS